MNDFIVTIFLLATANATVMLAIEKHGGAALYSEYANRFPLLRYLLPHWCELCLAFRLAVPLALPAAALLLQPQWLLLPFCCAPITLALYRACTNINLYGD